MFPPSTPRPNPPPKAGKRTWFMEWLNKSIPVVYGISFPRETPATYTFITKAAPSRRTSVLPHQRTNDTAERKYFRGWYEDAEFTGTPVSFPYFGNATTLYARFERNGCRTERAMTRRSNWKRA